MTPGDRLQYNRQAGRGLPFTIMNLEEMISKQKRIAAKQFSEYQERQRKRKEIQKPLQ